MKDVTTEKSDKMYPSMKDVNEKVDSEGNSQRSSKSAKKRAYLRYHSIDSNVEEMKNKKMATLDEYDLHRFEK